MAIRKALGILRRRARIPILLMIVAVVATGLMNRVSRPIYTATATVIARNSLTILKPIKFEEVAASSTIAVRVRQQLHLAESVPEFLRHLTVTATQSALYRVAVTDPQADRAVAIANAVSLEAARMYTDIAVGTPSTTSGQVDAERTSYREQYLAAAQRLLAYEALHPDAVAAYAALPPDLQGATGPAQSGDQALQSLPSYLAPTDANLRAQYLALRLAEQLAADAYQNFETETAKSQLTEMSNAHDYGAQVVDTAIAEPDTQARRTRIVYAATMALIAGIAIAFALEYLRPASRPGGRGTAWPDDRPALEQAL